VTHAQEDQGIESNVAKGWFRIYRPPKGSHSRWYHERLKGEPVTLAGNDGDDARRYQEKMVERAIEEVMRPK